MQTLQVQKLTSKSVHVLPSSSIPQEGHGPCGWASCMDYQAHQLVKLEIFYQSSLNNGFLVSFLGTVAVHAERVPQTSSRIYPKHISYPWIIGIKVEPTLGKAIKKMTFYVGKEYRVAWVLFLNCFFWNITQALCFPRHASFSLFRRSKVILLTPCSLKEEFQQISQS